MIAHMFEEHDSKMLEHNSKILYSHMDEGINQLRPFHIELAVYFELFWIGSDLLLVQIHWKPSKRNNSF